MVLAMLHMMKSILMYDVDMIDPRDLLKSLDRRIGGTVSGNEVAMRKWINGNIQALYKLAIWPLPLEYPVPVRNQVPTFKSKCRNSV